MKEVIVREINEGDVTLCWGDGVVIDIIRNNLQANDVRCQIKNLSAEGYYFVKDGKRFDINSKGQIIVGGNGTDVYCLFDYQMNYLVGLIDYWEYISKLQTTQQ